MDASTFWELWKTLVFLKIVTKQQHVKSHILKKSMENDSCNIEVGILWFQEFNNIFTSLSL